MDDNFIKLIKKEIIDFKLIYAAIPYNPEYISAIIHDFKIMISAS